ncbi:MAG: exodeoxyribonuclease V subunit gamma [Burkholderiales bacterium]|nr:exodeoxyribonuclease V subunit gamma [Burkholderiales bacterium]
MLHLYQSNRLETLSELLHGVLAVPPTAVYARETVIVQARGMGRWLSLRVAERFGICANIDFPLPASFLWQLTETVLGPQHRRSAFGVDEMAWRVHAMLATPPAALADYLADGRERRRWRLARRLADLFDSYLVYRPDWLATWEAGSDLGLGPDEAWQAVLWRRLAADRQSPHRADLLGQLVKRLRNPAPLALPDRVIAFGMSSLPPALLSVLKALAQRCDVCLFVLNPSETPWRDVDRRAQAELVGERLLAAWGGQGRDFLDRIAGEVELHSLFLPTAADTLLSAVQQSVLTLVPIEQPSLDDSIAIHACHSPLRQVETLKDALLARLRNDPSLQADDIVVLCPDIETYAPHVEAVFGHGEPSLPYAVADRGGLSASPLLNGFVTLLSMVDGGWEASAVLPLLEIPELAQSFGLKEDDLPLVRAWVAEAGVRRGRTGDAFSWDAGIGRLLLGTAMPDRLDDTAQVFAGLHPVADLDLRFGERVAGLARFVRTLARWQDVLQAPRPLTAWSRLLLDWVNTWFGVDHAAEPTRERLRLALVALGDVAGHSGMEQAVGHAAVTEYLGEKLADASGAGGFLTGGITFAQLVPMRNIPFRVIAVLGLEDGAFPREQRPDGFDLMSRQPRAGDRSRRLDDRWLFLETVLAARDALLLFYTGRDARSDVTLPPSTVIADLLDAIAENWGSERAEAVQHSHPLQPFSPRRFAADAALPSFDMRWAKIAAHAGTGDALPATLADWHTLQEMPAEVELADLLAFARDPAGWFLRRQGVRFERAERALEEREPSTLSNADARQLLALSGAQADDAAALHAVGAAAAILPAGKLGEAWATRAAAEFAPAVARWRELPQGELALDLQLDKHRLIGTLRGVGPNGLALRQPGPLWESVRIDAWLRHLCLCASGSANPTQLVGLDELAHYAPPGNSRELLEAWLDLYLMAHRQPPTLLPRGSLAAAAGARSKDGDVDLAAGLDQAIKAWVGNERVAGEGSFPNTRALWREQPPLDEDFVAQALQLFGPMLAAETFEKLT